MTQLTLDLGLLPESVITPPIPLTAALKRALVTQMAAALIAVYQAGGTLTDDHRFTLIPKSPPCTCNAKRSCICASPRIARCSVTPKANACSMT